MRQNSNLFDVTTKHLSRFACNSKYAVIKKHGEIHIMLWWCFYVIGTENFASLNSIIEKYDSCKIQNVKLIVCVRNLYLNRGWRFIHDNYPDDTPK